MQNKLKYLIPVIIIIFSNTAFALTNNELLNNIENDIFGYDFSKDSTQNRVSRIEKTIYGKAKSGDLNKRISTLSGDISADVIGLEIEPVRDTFLAMEEAEEDSSVNYPVVNEIEQKLFNKTYKNRDFHTRIVTIEKKLFGKIYDVDDYPTRLDRIKSKIMPETVANKEKFENEYHDYDYTESFNQPRKNTFNGFRIPFGQKNYTRHYANYGDYDNITDSVMPGDNLSDDLSQMEYDMFGTEFSNEDAQTRIKRLNSANKAKKSKPKYDSQKFSQHMSTAMEIGAMILMILAMVL